MGNPAPDPTTPTNPTPTDPAIPTPAQVAQYLANEGAQCVYCQSEKLVYSNTEQDDSLTISMKVTCRGCDKSWHDIYTLSHIAVDNGATEVGPS